MNDKEAHVGLLQFSDEKSMSYEFALNEMHSNKQVKRAIKRMKYRAGAKTNTGDALRIVNRYVSVVRNANTYYFFVQCSPLATFNTTFCSFRFSTIVMETDPKQLTY